MNPSIDVFVRSVKEQHPNFFNNTKVLEVGSYNINGTIRGHFAECDYTGIDLHEGDDVDIVCSGHKFDPGFEYDVVASTDCFEHNPYWLETFERMHLLCRDGGLVFFTCATEGMPVHGTREVRPDLSPYVAEHWNYYQNRTEKDFETVFDLADMFSFYNFDVLIEKSKEYPNITDCNLCFYGIVK